jgi:glycosyltransferase involved in cell wall biosynthesis
VADGWCGHNACVQEQGEAIEASVVIAALDAARTIERQLRALALQDPPFAFEVIIADNGSTDDTWDRALAWTDRIGNLRVVDASSRPGAGFARNCGAEAAWGQVLVFCDADDEVDPGWLAAIVPAAKAAGLASGPVQVLGSDDIERAPSTALDVPFGFLPTAPTANLAIRRDVFERLGGFTTVFNQAGGEDADLCWRAQLDAGAQLAFAPGASITYHARGTVRERLQRVWHYEQCNARLYVMYRGRGMRRGPVLLPLKRLAWVLRHPRAVLRDRRARDRSLRWMVGHASRLAASVRLRIVFP